MPMPDPTVCSWLLSAVQRCSWKQLLDKYVMFGGQLMQQSINNVEVKVPHNS